MRGKRGQGVFGLSFGMIFSIIIIVAIIAVAFYVISFFLKTNECTKVGLFFNSLDKETQKAWKSASYRGTFEGDLPKNVESVCFGDFNSLNIGKDYRDEAAQLKDYFYGVNKNVFLLPPSSGCEESLAYYKLSNVEIPGEFICSDNLNGKIKVMLEKGSFDNLVKITNG